MYRHLLCIPFGVLILSIVACKAPEAARAGESITLPDPARYSEQTINLQGRVVLVDDLNLSFPIAGQLAELSVEVDDDVHAGDVLARLDTTILDAELAMAQGELAVAEASLVKIQAGLYPLEIAEAGYEIVDASGTPEPDPADAEEAADPELLLAQPLPETVASAQAAVERARANVVLAEARQAQATLIAPTDGTVVAVSAQPHEFVSAGEPLVHIADLRRLEIETVGLPEADFARIQNGTAVTVSFDALEDVEATGVVTAVTPTTTSAGDLDFTARIALDEIPAGLRWGMTARIELPLDR
jgi:multidrug efflux pump subunit AcrA (membrane-fusion protein)